MVTEEQIEALAAKPEIAREIERALKLDDSLPPRLEAFIEKVAEWPEGWEFSRPQAKLLLDVQQEQRLVDAFDGISAALLVNDVWNALSDGSDDATIERVERLLGRSQITMRDFSWLLALSQRLDGRPDFQREQTSDRAAA